MSIAAWLVAMVGPLVARVLLALGLSVVTLSGATVALGTLKTNITGYIGGLPADALAIGGLMGIWEALGIVLGAMTFCITWRATAGFWKLAKT
jgi:hypothetical protein